MGMYSGIWFLTRGSCNFVDTSSEHAHHFVIKLSQRQWFPLQGEEARREQGPRKERRERGGRRGGGRGHGDRTGSPDAPPGGSMVMVT